MSIQRYHRIHPAVVVLVASDAHGTEDAAEAVGANALHQAGVDAVQVLVDVGGAEHLCHFALTGQAVVAEEELLHGLMATVTAVSRAWLLLVPMNEAMRGSVVLCLA